MIPNCSSSYLSSFQVSLHALDNPTINANYYTLGNDESLALKVVARIGFYSVTNVLRKHWFLFKALFYVSSFLGSLPFLLDVIAAALLLHSLMLKVVISLRAVVFAVFVRAPVVPKLSTLFTTPMLRAHSKIAMFYGQLMRMKAFVPILLCSMLLITMLPS